MMWRRNALGSVPSGPKSAKEQGEQSSHDYPPQAKGKQVSMTTRNSIQARYRMSSGRMELVDEDGHVLLSRSISEPKRLSPTRRDNSQLFRIRREFTEFIVRNGIDIVEGGAA